MASLDIQEGVHIDKYIPLIKNVVKPDGVEIECRLYQMLDVPSKPIDYSDPTIPNEHKPSKSMQYFQVYFKYNLPFVNTKYKNVHFRFFPLNTAYKEVFVKGGEESQLPEKYVGFLKSIVHNEREAHPELLAKLFGDKQ